MNKLMPLLLSVLLSGCTMHNSATSHSAESDLRLYVLDCGALRLDDVTGFGLANDETLVREMFVPCYLIDHPQGRLLWDGGLPIGIAGAGEVKSPGFILEYKRSVFDQLEDIGVDQAEIDYVAFSHMTTSLR